MLWKRSSMVADGGHGNDGNASGTKLKVLLYRNLQEWKQNLIINKNKEWLHKLMLIF